MDEVKRKLVLLVDDDLTITLTMKRFVINAGFDVITAGNGAEAVEKCKERVPDLIVMDAVMPQMNGWQATREIRKIIGQVKLPIIMMTGLRAEADKETALESGVSEYLVKPVKGEDLVRRIVSYLGNPFRT